MDEKHKKKHENYDYDKNHEVADEARDEHEEKEDEQDSELEQKLQNAEEQSKRYLADYQNLQRRVQEEKYQWVRQANKDLLLKLLPVLDTLMLAQKHINDKGLELSIHQFLQTLEQEGVKRIKTVGEKFNPHLMEAVGTAEGKKDMVVEEVRPGFTLYDNVLRSAQVIVGQ